MKNLNITIILRKLHIDFPTKNRMHRPVKFVISIWPSLPSYNLLTFNGTWPCTTDIINIKKKCIFCKAHLIKIKYHHLNICTYLRIDVTLSSHIRKLSSFRWIKTKRYIKQLLNDVWKKCQITMIIIWIRVVKTTVAETCRVESCIHKCMDKSSKLILWLHDY